MKISLFIIGLLISFSSWAGTLYTTPNCSACAKAKQALQNSCIKYKETQIGRDNPYGFTTVPVYDTDDGQRLRSSYEIIAWAESHNQCR